MGVPQKLKLRTCLASLLSTVGWLGRKYVAPRPVYQKLAEMSVINGTET